MEAGFKKKRKKKEDEEEEEVKRETAGGNATEVRSSSETIFVTQALIKFSPENIKVLSDRLTSLCLSCEQLLTFLVRSSPKSF